MEKVPPTPMSESCTRSTVFSFGPSLWMAFRSLTDFLSLVIYQNWSSKSWITEYRRPSTTPCAPLCSSRFISVYEKLRLNPISFSQYWYVSLNCQALSLLSSRGDTLKPSKIFLYSFGFECLGCWQIIGCKIQEEWGLNPHEGQPISFCSAVADLESEIEKKLGLNPHEIQLISFLLSC